MNNTEKEIAQRCVSYAENHKTFSYKESYRIIKNKKIYDTNNFKELIRYGANYGTGYSVFVNPNGKFYKAKFEHASMVDCTFKMTEIEEICVEKVKKEVMQNAPVDIAVEIMKFVFHEEIPLEF